MLSGLIDWLQLKDCVWTSYLAKDTIRIGYPLGYCTAAPNKVRSRLPRG